MKQNKQKLVYLVSVLHNGEFSFAVQSFTDGNWICEQSVSCPVDFGKEDINKLLRNFGADVRKTLVKEGQEILFGEVIPVRHAASFGKPIRQFTPLSGMQTSLFFEGFSI